MSSISEFSFELLNFLKSQTCSQTSSNHSKIESPLYSRLLSFCSRRASNFLEVLARPPSCSNIVKPFKDRDSSLYSRLLNFCSSFKFSRIFCSNNFQVVQTSSNRSKINGSPCLANFQARLSREIAVILSFSTYSCA